MNHLTTIIVVTNHAKRVLKVVRWLNTTPAIGICEQCNKLFKVPLTALTKTFDAQTNLQEQFARHKCRGVIGQGV